MKVLIWLLFSLFALNSAEELGQDLNIESSNVFDTSASINPYNWLSGAQNFVSFYFFTRNPAFGACGAGPTCEACRRLSVASLPRVARFARW